MLHAKSIEKSYPQNGFGRKKAAKIALKNFSLDCHGGEVIGLLGENGAGKTTALRTLSCALKADQGKLCIQGKNPLEQPLEVRHEIGYLSSTTNLYDRLTVRENLVFFGELYGLNAATLKTRIEELTDLLTLSAFIDAKVKSLSTGMKQRAAISRALIHDPKIVIFDEPTTGLDVQSANAILDLIRTLKTAGKAVIFSTHHMHEVAAVCDKITILHIGSTVYSGTPNDFVVHQKADNLYEAFIAFQNQLSESD